MNRVRAVLARGSLLGLLWWVLTEGDSPGWYYGVVAVVAALALSLHLSPPVSGRGRRLRRAWHGSGLAAWFVLHSVLGGLDVSRRILSRTVDIAPEVQRHPLRLPPGHPRQLALAMVSLMPGTLVVGTETGAEGDTVLIHVLDARTEVAESWAQLQRRMAAASGLPPQGADTDEGPDAPEE